MRLQLLLLPSLSFSGILNEGLTGKKGRTNQVNSIRFNSLNAMRKGERLGGVVAVCSNVPMLPRLEGIVVEIPSTLLED